MWGLGMDFVLRDEGGSLGTRPMQARLGKQRCTRPGFFHDTSIWNDSNLAPFLTMTCHHALEVSSLPFVAALPRKCIFSLCICNKGATQAGKDRRVIEKFVW